MVQTLNITFAVSVEVALVFIANPNLPVAVPGQA
jgi:hypothetical protein